MSDVNGGEPGTSLGTGGKRTLARGAILPTVKFLEYLKVHSWDILEVTIKISI